MSTSEDRLLLTIDEVCTRLHISRPTFYGLVHSGQLRTITIGRARRIPVSALEDYVAEQLRSQGAPRPSPGVA